MPIESLLLYSTVKQNSENQFFSIAFVFMVFLFESLRIRKNGSVLSAGRWRKFTFIQIHDGSRTKAQSAEAFEKGFIGFGLLSVMPYY